MLKTEIKLVLREFEYFYKSTKDTIFSSVNLTTGILSNSVKFPNLT